MNNISKSDLSTKGFSALELMVSIGILGILAGITLNQFKQMKMKAYQVEAVRTTAFVDSLMKDFFSERNRFPLDSECPEGLYRGDECLLGHPDRDNSECYHENTFGSYDHGDEIFIDCERTQYYYSYTINSANRNQYVVEAFSRGKFMGCSGVEDRYYRNQCGKTCNYISFNPGTCETIIRSCGDRFSC